MKKKENWICKFFGHKADITDKALSSIKRVAINKKELDPRVICKRCGKEFIPEKLK